MSPFKDIEKNSGKRKVIEEYFQINQLLLEAVTNIFFKVPELGRVAVEKDLKKN